MFAAVAYLCCVINADFLKEKGTIMIITTMHYNRTVITVDINNNTNTCNIHMYNDAKSWFNCWFVGYAYFVRVAAADLEGAGAW